MGQVFKITDRDKKSGFWDKRSLFFWFDRGREGEESKSSFGNPQSFIGRNSSSQEYNVTTHINDIFAIIPIINSKKLNIILEICCNLYLISLINV